MVQNRHHDERSLSVTPTSFTFKDQHTSRDMDETKQTHSTETVSDSSAEVGFDPLVLGQQFCQWFFQLLNSQNPLLGQQPQNWGPQHFWPDVKLHLLSR